MDSGDLNCVYVFDSLTVDLQNLRITLGDEVRPLEPKSFRLLVFLIENQYRTVSKEEIFKAIWVETAVTDNSLTRAIVQIRKALNDDFKEPKYIETVPTVGYRFIGDAKPVSSRTPSRAENSAWQAVSATADGNRPLGFVVVAILLAIVIGGGWWLTVKNSGPPAPFHAVKVAKLTQLAGQQTDPAFSPDGRSVAFSWGEQGSNRDIYIMTIGTSPPVRLTQDAANDMSPAWSPDGKQIAYIRLEGVLNASVMVVSAAGGSERILRQVHIREDVYRAMRPLVAWTPDGRQIVYAARDDESERNSIFLTDLQGTTQRKLFESPDASVGNAAPAFSPDGKWLAYTVVFGPHQAQLFVRRLGHDWSAQEDPIPVTAAPGSQITSPVWSRDGKRLVFVQDSAIFEWQPGRSPAQIYAGTGWGTMSATWGPGQALRMVTGDANYSETDRAELRWIPLQPGGLAPAGESVPFGSAVAQSTPSFSPDGKWVAFRSPSSGTNEVWVADQDGRNARQLTHLHTGVGGFLRWSPDGKRIAFHVSGGSKPQIYTLNVEQIQPVQGDDAAGVAPKKITDSAFGFYSPTWSADTRYLYVDRVTGGSRIFRIPVTGGQPEELFEGATSRVTLDGRKIVYAKIGHLGIFSRSLAGDPATNPEEKLVEDYRPPGSDINPVSDGLYYVSWNGANQPRPIRFYGYAKKKSVDVFLPSGRIPDSPGLAVSPDRRRLIYSQLTETVKNLTLLEFH